ncbi:M56 family metallopeptidase [Chitinophaga pendula]|uniref:M56 family metallopeptidase n=1 Tax=Chitinophaga TaxID=79328 RepID=UPI000BB05BC6|nr:MULTISPECIES: M56 family metallopeptidase [Chitinophaga]ASZ13955.1 hypothetical protein CK934_24885 [Chitinophaga sp. MD30]UCJ08422.1 M56 family metallopeptidase [Chitinophaga pendula]
MSTLFSLGTPMIQALGWTLLHSIWQALLVYGCLKAVLYLWPDASARTKYNLSFLSMAGIFGWFCITLWEQVSAAREWSYQLVYDTEAVMEAPPMASVMGSEASVPADIFPHLEVCFPLLVAFYVAGVAVMLIKLLVDVRQLYSIKTRQVKPAEVIQAAHLPKLLLLLGISRPVQVMVSEYLQVPVMIGVLKPVILLPAVMLSQLSTEQLEAILLHELAHIKRNDYLLNIFQSIVETLLFFNPFVWWISKNIRLEREHCCDDLVVVHTAPLHYAKALVALEEYRFTSNSLAMAAADDKHHLFHRIKRIMEMKTKHLNYSQRLLAMLIIAGSLISIAWLNPDTRQEQDRPTLSQGEQPVTDTVAPLTATAGEREAPAAPIAATPAADVTPLPVTDTVLPGGEKGTAPADDKTNWVVINNEHGDSSFTTINDSSFQYRFQKGLDVRVNDVSNRPVKVMVSPRQLKVNTSTNTNIDWKKIDTEVETALNNIDWGKINQDIARAKKNSNVSAAEMRKQVDAAVKQGLKSAQESMRKDMKGLQRELAFVQRDLANIDFRGVSDDALKGLDFDKLSEETRKGLKEARAQSQAAMQKAFSEMKRLQDERHDEINHPFRDLAINGRAGRVLIHHNNKDIDYKDMIAQLKGERLIETDRSFSIKFKDEQLYINGDKQPEDIKRRYRRYLDNVKSLTIKGNKSNLSISVSK